MEYPKLICAKCAIQNGGHWPKGHVASFYLGACGWCGEDTEVTQARDWCYPTYDKKIKLSGK